MTYTLRVVTAIKTWYDAQSDDWHDQGWEFTDILDMFCNSHKCLTPPAKDAVPDGMVLVPKEPTEEMYDAAWKDIPKVVIAKLSIDQYRQILNRSYRAMLAAAPVVDGLAAAIRAIDVKAKP
jgi:hypothetical protein